MTIPDPSDVDLPDVDQCEHETTMTATEHDTPPEGTVICTDCGLKLSSPTDE